MTDEAMPETTQPDAVMPWAVDKQVDTVIDGQAATSPSLRA